MTFCAENENCYFRKKGKQSEADLKDFISCHIPGCNRQFHVKCIGFNKTTKEKYKYSFVCTRCNNFLQTLRSIISEEISCQLNKMAKYDSSMATCSETHAFIPNTHNDTVAENSVDSAGDSTGTEDRNVGTGNSVDDVDGSARTGNSVDGVDDGEGTVNSDSANKSTVDGVIGSAKAENNVDGVSNNCGSVMGVTGGHGGLKESKESETVSHLVLSTIKADNVCNNANSVKPFYLCHIEKELTLDDIKLILEDNNIKFDTLDMFEIEGDFTARKYIKIVGSVKNNFKFKIDLENSPLKSTWYHKMNPPVARKKTTNIIPTPSNSIVIKSTKKEQNKGDKTRQQINNQPAQIEVQNLNRDKILMLQNHNINTFKNNKINSIRKENALNSVKSFLEDILKEKIKR